MSIRSVVLASSILAVGLAAQVEITPLLRNGGGEEGAVQRRADAAPVAGWTAVSGTWTAQRAPWSKIDALEGHGFLRPLSGDAPELEQVVDLAPAGAPQPKAIVLRASLRTGRGKDRAAIRLELIDSRGGTVATVESGERAETSWTAVVLAAVVPAKAVSARVTLSGTRNDGEFADALFDAITLEEFGPGLPIGVAGLPLDRVTALLDDGDEVTRRAAERAVAVEARGQRLLLDRFKASTDPARRAELATALALAACNAAIDPLGALLTSSASADLELGLALAPVSGADLGKLVAPLLARERPAAVRRAALRALIAAARPDALRALQRFAKADPKDHLLALSVLVASGAPLEPVYRALIAPALADDVEPGVRAAAMQALAAARDPRFMAQFAQWGRREEAPDRLAGWFRAAVAIDGERAMTTILELLDVRTALAERALLASADSLTARAAVEWARRKGIGNESATQRRAALRILGGAARAEDLTALRTACADGDDLVAVEAVTALARLGGSIVDTALAELTARATGPVAAAALRARVARGGDLQGVDDELLALIREHRSWEVRVAALDLLTVAAGSDHLQPQLTLLAIAVADPVWQVRAAAYRCLSRVRERAAVDVLIGRLLGEDGAALPFLCDALVVLCGVDNGDDGAAWQRWWNIVRADFVVADPPAKKPAAPRAGTSTEYWGIPIRGRNLAFVLDLSGSMNTPLDGKTRLAIAKERLIEVLRALPAGHRFSIVAFGTEVEPFERALVPVEKDTVERATKWIERLAVHGSTNIYDSLEYALAIPDVEAVYLLTDGAPSSGKLVDMDEIRRAIRMQNAERTVRVNTIRIGGGRREGAFLRELAAENHGESRER